MLNKYKPILGAIGIIGLILLGVCAYNMDKPSAEVSGDQVYTPPTTAATAATTMETLPSKEKLLCRYTQLSKAGEDREKLQVYIPCQVGYCEVEFRHSASDEANYDVWRIDSMTAVDDQLIKRYSITNTGEFEAAIRLQDRDDFSGGSNHGDEIVTSVSCYIDDTSVQISALSELTAFSEMRIVRRSTLYDPTDHNTPIADHTVEYVFDLEGVTVDQSVKWLVSETCHTSYLAMFPVLRTTKDSAGNKVVVSEYYEDDASQETYSIIEAGKSEYPQTWKQGVKKITLSSRSLGLETTLEMLECTQVPGAGYSQCSPASQYNKLYFSITGFGSGADYQVTEGEAWETVTRYRVSITK